LRDYKEQDRPQREGRGKRSRTDYRQDLRDYKEQDRPQREGRGKRSRTDYRQDLRDYKEQDRPHTGHNKQQGAGQTAN